MISRIIFLLLIGEVPFGLKGCLSGDVLSTEKGVDNDYDAMFRRLDFKYRRPEKLADD